ncbi:hypothetical protein [Actinoplanes sp. NPDC049265]|uniref:hypothetical protein n=1 Tax=Actinoplanes sp. NPDC049265 TaxID=3363902 RepID=UPI003720FE83
MNNVRSKAGHALISGGIALVIGLVATYVAWQLTPHPWSLGSALIAVSFASFFAAFGGSMAALTTARRGDRPA